MDLVRIVGKCFPSDAREQSPSSALGLVYPLYDEWLEKTNHFVIHTYAYKKTNLFAKHTYAMI